MSEGGKAAGLRSLASFAPVPHFVVIPDAQAASPSGITEAVANAALSPPYAVRSSADVEDGEGAAFAGMFRTRLGVSASDLTEAVMDVAASLTSPRLSAYIESRAALLATPCRMHVIVQEMIDARVSGVCVTRLPETDAALITIEAIFGLGELLVSGIVEPDLYHVERATASVTVANIGNQALQLTLGQGETLVPGHLCRAPKLTHAEAQEIATLGLKVESNTSWIAADIEWAYDARQLWALQARPVTSLGQP